MEKLATLLGRERLLLELLTFKLVELRQLLAAGETRFLDWAAEEVDRALTGMRGSSSTGPSPSRRPSASSVSTRTPPSAS